MIQDIATHSCVIDGVPTLKCLEVVFANILIISSSIVVLVLFVMFVIGSFGYLTSAGDPEKIKKAQGTLKYALIGMLLFLVSYLVLSIINTLFGLKGSLIKFKLPG